MQAWADDELMPYSFIHGLCSWGSCSGYANRFSLAGSLECMSLINWPEVPVEILRYQLDLELSFLAHPHHPSNEKIFETC